MGNAGELPDGSWATFDLDFARVRERLYDIAGSLNHVAQSGALLEPRRLLDAYEGTAPEPLTRDERRWLPGALALIPLHWTGEAEQVVTKTLADFAEALNLVGVPQGVPASAAAQLAWNVERLQAGKEIGERPASYRRRRNRPRPS